MVIFNEEKHTYVNPETNRYYISVSSLLSLYKEPFDREFYAQRQAIKEGTTKKDILEKWDKIKDDACDKGKTYHSILENYIKDGIVDDEKIINSFKPHFNRQDYILVRSEHIVFNDEYEIAGTSDLICDVNNETFDVYDFKTNKKFLFENKYNKYLKPPLNNLQQCHFNDYSLQLSLYAYLYGLHTNKKVRKICIVYFERDEIKIYHTPYMFWEISVLIKHYLQNHGQTAVKQNKNVIAKLQS